MNEIKANSMELNVLLGCQKSLVENCSQHIDGTLIPRAEGISVVIN